MKFAQGVMFIAIFVLFNYHDSHCVKILKFRVPEAARRNQKVTLTVNYFLEEKENVMEVVWYLEDRTLCRFDPFDTGTFKCERYDGLRIHKDQSTINNLTLTPTSRNAAGNYKCVLISNFPANNTAKASKMMDVVDLPPTGPLLTGTHEGRTYALGTTLMVNCSCVASYPAANLSFFINDRKVQNPYAVTYFALNGVPCKELETAYGSLTLKIQRSHINEWGQIRIKCVSNIYMIYYSSDERLVSIDITADQTKLSYVQKFLDEEEDPYNNKFTTIRKKSASTIGDLLLLKLIFIVSLLLFM